MIVPHLDEHGEPCARHAAAEPDALLSLALIGSRASSFHHDLASKLQGLMMALDEIAELGLPGTELVSATEVAQLALREILALLNINRALTRPPTRTRAQLGELFTRAAERTHITLGGDLPATPLEVSVPSLTHALALTMDIAAGPGRGRQLSVSAEVIDDHVVVTLAASPSPPAHAAEALALAGFVLAREHGTLRCAADGSAIVLRLPVAS